MKLKTEKQKKAVKRNFMIMSIKAMVSLLELFRENYCKSYVLKGTLNSAIMYLEHTLGVLKHSKCHNPENYLDAFYS